MSLLILMQILTIGVRSCWSEEEYQTTMIIGDTRTEMTVEEVSGFARDDKGYSDYFQRPNEADGDFDFGDSDFDYGDEGEPTVDIGGSGPPTEHLMKEAMLKAMKKPAIRQQIGEVIPILRVMSPAQRLTLAALVSSQIMSQGRLSEADLTEMASTFAGSHTNDADERQNITEHLLLPISVDIAKIFRGLGKDIGRSLLGDAVYSGGTGGPIPRRSNLFRRQVSKRMDDFTEESNERDHQGKNSTENGKKSSEPSDNECEYFSASFCLEVADYPLDAIIMSVEKHRGVMDTLLEDFRMQMPEAASSPPSERQRSLRRQDVAANEVRDDQKEKEHMCPSSVKFARPKRARTTSGEWKYVVNAGDYTQTLRLEMCLKPLSPCSYLTNNFQSQCRQVYNYHRLLTWEENKGLHMDMFKVPSCCSCHIQGYAPYNNPRKDLTFSEKRPEPIPVRSIAGSRTNLVSNYLNPAGKRDAGRPVPSVPVTGASLRSAITFPPKVIRGVPERLTPLHHLVPSGPPLPLEGETLRFRGDPHPHNQRAVDDHRRVGQVPANKPDSGGFQDETMHIKHFTDFPGNRLTDNHSKSYTESARVTTTRVLPYSGRNPVSEETIAAESENPPVLQELLGPTKSKVSSTHWRTTSATATANPTPATPVPVVPQLQKSVIRQETTDSNGKKRVNYNYHPIIEFFAAGYGNSTQQRFSKPPNTVMGTQGWKPLVTRL